MIGREAYHNPYLLAEIGQLWNLDLPDRFEIIDQMLPYIAKRMLKVRLCRLSRAIFLGYSKTFRALASGVRL
jgi:tRNA-dihydrouridine synthase